jgi:hypothetical protein
MEAAKSVIGRSLAAGENGGLKELKNYFILRSFQQQGYGGIEPCLLSYALWWLHPVWLVRNRRGPAPQPFLTAVAMKLPQCAERLGTGPKEPSSQWTKKLPSAVDAHG